MKNNLKKKKTVKLEYKANKISSPIFFFFCYFEPFVSMLHSLRVVRVNYEPSAINPWISWIMWEE